MGQEEVYFWLRTQREIGINDYFSISDVKNGLKVKGYSNGVIEKVGKHLIRLEGSGFVEIKVSGKVRDWKRLFRLKSEYCDNIREEEYT